MRTHWIAAVCVVMLTVATGTAAGAGDSIYGTVTAVRRADLVVFDYGSGSYLVHVVGIDLPRDREAAAYARTFVAGIVLHRHVRIRIEGRRDGILDARILTADSVVGFNHDVGLELVRNGFARRMHNFDYSYGELSGAEREARLAGRGVWAAERNR